MKVIVILFCIILSVRFVYNFQKVNTVDGWKWCIKAAVDAFMIIGFAIIEKGRW